MEIASVVPARERDKRTLNALAKAEKTVVHQDNFTVVVFRNGKGVVVGAAKRNPRDDNFVAERGEAIAMVRAYRAFREKGWQK